MDAKTQYDVIILGAGPSGFTACIYLARFRFRVLLLDHMVPQPNPQGEEAGRSSVLGIYHNVPGFPEGINREELKWRGIHQAQNLGCDYRIDKAVAITRHPQHFTVHCETREYTGTYLFFAMGVQDIWPELPGLARYVGDSLFWSVEANGYEAQGKMSGVIGYDDHTALEAVRLKDYTDNVTLFTHGHQLACSNEMKRVLDYLRIPVATPRIKTVAGKDTTIEKVILENNQEVNVQILFTSSQFRIPRSQLAQKLGIQVDSAGYIHINERFETSVPNVFAIGDITARGPEQVVTSYYQGMQAAWALYEEVFQKHLQHLLASSQEVPHFT